MADCSEKLRAIAPRLKSSNLLEPCQGLASDNPPWDTAKGRYLIVRLSPLRDVASSTGHLFLHNLLRTTLGKDAFIDFAFLPSGPERRELSAAGISHMFGIFSRHEAVDFHAILVSCSYAPELVNLPAMLMHSGIPVRSGSRRAGRQGGGTWPLIILGGSNALASQALIFEDGDSFADGIFFGEGEAGGRELVRAIAATEWMAPGERLGRLAAATDAFWPAGSTEGPRVRVARCCPDVAALVDGYPVLNTDEASTARIQLSWGCPSTCTFCFEGWEHKPYREVPKDVVLETARRLAAGTGANTLELYAFNFNAHTDAGDLILGLNRIFERVNMMSQRADLLLTTPRMLDLELAAEKTSFTIGVEGISEGMRAFYSKGLTTGVLNRLLERLAREKVREVKLFYILAGVETDGDVGEFEAFCQFVAGLRQRNDRGLRVLFSFGYLVRMPFTPLRKVALGLDRKAMEAVADRLRRIVEKAGFEFRLATEWDEYVTDQLMVLGPHGMAGALEAAAADGAAFDGTVDPGLLKKIEMTLRAKGLLGADGLTGPLVDEKPADWPWALGFLDTAAGPEYLADRASLAVARQDGGSCMAGLDGVGDRGACLGCGACRTAEETAALEGHSIRPIEAGQAARLGEVIRTKRRMRPRYLTASLPETLAGATAEFLKAWLLRSVLSRQGDLIGRLFRVEEALWASPELRDRFVPGMTGRCVLALYGMDERVGGEPPRLCDRSFAMAAAALSDALGCEVSELAAVGEGTLAGARVRIVLPQDVSEQDAQKRVRRYLAELKLNATERRIDGGRLFEIAPKDVKKRILKTVTVMAPAPDAGTPAEIHVDGGPRLDIAPLFGRSAERAGAVIEVQQLVRAD